MKEADMHINSDAEATPKLPRGRRFCTKRDFIAFLLAIIIVVSSAFCITPEDEIRLEGKANVPYIAIARDDFPVEKSISAGFFLPTDKNVNCRVAMPKLTCTIEVVDVGSINVFKRGERARIIADLDPDPNVMVDNILDSICLSEAQNLADMAAPVVDDRAFFEDIATGTKYFGGQLREFDDGVSILSHKSSSMIFSVPVEFIESLAKAKNFMNDNGENTHFLKVRKSDTLKK